MAFPLATVLTAAPGIISAAADIIGAIRHRKQTPAKPKPHSDPERVDELAALIERQAMVIEELALNNRNLVLAVRNNRILSTISTGIGLLALGLAIWL